MPSGDKRKYGLKYSKESHFRIVQAVKLGATNEMAAKAGGISARTLRNWMADARRNGEKSPFHQLLLDVEAADGASGINALACIQKAAKEGKWQAAAWLLERKHGFRRDGVKELQQDVAVIPGSLEKHEVEILGEIRRLRLAATGSGSMVAAARLLEMEAQLVSQRKEEQRQEDARTHANATENELLELIATQAEAMPKKVIDDLVKRLTDIQRKAS